MKSKFDFTVYPNLPAPDGVWMPVYPRRSSVDTLGLAQIERLDPRGGTEYISVQNLWRSFPVLVVELGTRLDYKMEEFFIVKYRAEILPQNGRKHHYQHPILSLVETSAWIYVTLSADSKPYMVYDDFRDEWFEDEPYEAYKFEAELYKYGIICTEAPRRHWHRGDPYKF